MSDPRRSLAIRHHEFAILQQELAVAMARLNQASVEKQRFIVVLGSRSTMSTEDWETFQRQLANEQTAFRQMNEVQDRFVDLLRTELTA
jgi:hypothetical protein